MRTVDTTRRIREMRTFLKGVTRTDIDVRDNVGDGAHRQRHTHRRAAMRELHGGDDA